MLHMNQKGSNEEEISAEVKNINKHLNQKIQDLKKNDEEEEAT